MLDSKAAFTPEQLVLFNQTGLFSDSESLAELWCGPNKDNKSRPSENLDLGLFAKESKRGSNLECFWKSQWGKNDWLDYVVYSQRAMRLFDLDAELAQRYRPCFHRKLQPVKKVTQCQIHMGSAPKYYPS